VGFVNIVVQGLECDCVNALLAISSDRLEIIQAVVNVCSTIFEKGEKDGISPCGLATALGVVKPATDQVDSKRWPPIWGKIIANPSLFIYRIK
jgi:hypothetical protein